MENLVWIGAGITVIGLIGLIYCIVKVAQARKTASDDEALRAQITKMVPINLGSFMLSALGLILVVIGVILA